MEHYHYPLLKRVKELYAEVDTSNTLLIASLHLLEPQMKMLELMGMKCIVAGKNYSTNEGVMKELKAQGHIVAPFSNRFNPHQSFDHWYPRQLTSFITKSMKGRKLQDYDRVIILEDGGFLHQVINELYDDVSNVVGIEQTSSGHHRIKKAGVRFPFISVARSYHKLVFESPYIGALGHAQIMRHIRSRGKTNPHILCLGLGPIGRQIAGRLFLTEKMRGFATDPRMHENDIWFTAPMDLLRGYGKLLEQPDLKKTLGAFDVIVGSSGSTLFTEDMIDHLHPEVSLISMSSSDREFPALAFRTSGGTIHDDYYLGERCLVNGGFPITFWGERNCIPPQQIEFVMALLMIQVMDSIQPLNDAALAIEQIHHLWRPDVGAKEWFKQHIQH